MLILARFLSPVLIGVACCLLMMRAPVKAQTQGQDYDVGPGDTIKIQVFQSPELAVETRIAEDGTIGMPLVGRLRVTGLTASKIESQISQALRTGNFIKEAQVNVQVLSYRSKMVSVLGYVSKPGRYPLEMRSVRLSEMLANAGGVSAAGSDYIVLSRMERSGSTSRREIDVAAIYLDGKAELDIELQAGDSIFVNRAPQIYVYGQVQRPGNFSMERNMTVSQALAKAGGFTLRARESGLRLQRRDPKTGKTVDTPAKMDDLIQPDDQIFARESLF